MKYVLDTHTHSIVSGHAYSTLMENIKEASMKGIEVLCTTEHGPSIPGGPHMFYFGNIDILPRYINGVLVLRGCEANIMDINGNIDLDDYLLNGKLDIVLASMHDVCIKAGDADYNTTAILNAMNNPAIDILGHLGNPKFPIHKDAIIKKAKDKNILIEINNGSFAAREGCEENCTEIASLCKEYEVKIALGSDAHFSKYIGDFSKAEKILKKVGMPEKLVVNTRKDKILKYLKEKGKISDINVI